MIKALQQFFTMFAVLFSAGERLANSADKLAQYAEEGTDDFLEQARIERKSRLKKLQAASES